MKKKRRINGQKIFSFISFIFILTCCIWYGGRLIYYYIDSHKEAKSTEVTLAKTLMAGNKSIKKINDSYYYYQNADNNYIVYSNLLFRILKITKDNKIVAITDTPVTSLAYGVDANYDNSPIITWLNKNSTNGSGILEANMNSVDKYLEKTNTCIDDIDDIKKVTCEKNVSNYFSLLTVSDYINIGSTKSFINNGYTTYLANANKDGEEWIINDDGKLSTDDGGSIYGVKTVITLKSSTKISKGDGTKNNPYRFEDEKSYFGSYVKLDKDIWRIYDEEEKLVKLSLNDYLKDGSSNLEYIYSNSNSFHNDTIQGSLAYYLNSTYLNSLSYKDKIVVNNYSNGFYNEDNDYDYTSSTSKLVDTKVSNLAIGNVMLNYSLNNYFLATGLYNKSDYVYLTSKNGAIDTIKVSNKANVIPCISIEKDKLKSGSGTKDDPYRME